MCDTKPFWQTKSLSQMSKQEWESLCDGCGRCCLNKLIDEESDIYLYTRTACKLLDLNSCRCSDYAHRTIRVPSCVALTPDNIKDLDWMPESCAYRLLSEGKDLPWWHPLVSGSPASVEEAGISVKGQVYSEKNIKIKDLVDHLWCLPKARRRR